MSFFLVWRMWASNLEKEHRITYEPLTELGLELFEGGVMTETSRRRAFHIVPAHVCSR